MCDEADHYMLAGTLPDAWGQAGAFPLLRNLTVSDLPLSGSLPPSWGSDNSFPALIELRLGALNPGTCQLNGSLPEPWGSNHGFGKLLNLVVKSCNLQGTYVTFDSSTYTLYTEHVVHDPSSSYCNDCLLQRQIFVTIGRCM